MSVHDVAEYLNVDEKPNTRLAQRGSLLGFKLDTWRAPVRTPTHFGHLSDLMRPKSAIRSLELTSETWTWVRRFHRQSSDQDGKT